MDTNLAILIGIGILAAAHVLMVLIECVTTGRRSVMDDAAAASVTLKRMAAEHPPGSDLAVTVGDVTVEVVTPDPADAEEGDEWKRV